MTRRGLLGTAAVVAGATVADLIHRPGKSKAATAPGGALSPAADGSSTSSVASPHAPTTRGATPTTAGTPSGGHSTAAASGGHSHPPAKSGHSHGASVTSDISHERSGSVSLPAPTVRVRTRPVYYVDQLIPDAPKHAIALTIDDGPSEEYTPKVLRLLDKYRMQASFCVVGAHADSYPKLIRDISRAGHVIVNHSYTHVQPFSSQSQARIVAEITRTQRSIEKATKVTPELFRSPGGDWSPFVFKAVAAYGLTPLDWDVDPLDWEMPGTQSIVRAMLRGRPNDIVICHDGGGDRIETVRALRKVLPTWKHRGYVTVPLTVPSGGSVATPPASTSSGTSTASASSTPTPSTTSPTQPSGSPSLQPETTIQ
jgi:peptidoglycan/xylan/chitin deacetylase (PgdA/CDA1 family)